MLRSLVLALVFATALAAAEGPDVRGFFGRHCTACHNDTAKTAGLSLAADDPAALPHAALEASIARLRGGLMPPPGLPRPDDTERQAVVAWMEARLEETAAAAPNPGSVTLRRLNRAEYDNTVRDLLGVDLRPSKDFPPDDTGYGFDTIGDVLSLSPLLMERYLSAARKLAARAVDLGPAPKPVLERYVADTEEQYRRTDPDDPKGYPFAPGDFEAEHDFPAAGVYELNIEIKDSRSGTAKSEASPRVALLLDGRELDGWTVVDGEYQAGYFGVRIPVPAGRHTVAGRFDANYVNNETRDYYKDGQAVPTRRIFINRIDIEGPFEYDPRAQPAWKRLFVCEERTAACARQILASLARRAYRRPPAEQEIDELLALVDRARSKGEPFEAGIRLALEAVLVSPNFLFRVERQAPPGEIVELSDFEIASRLSYFLWSSMPDDELLAAAERGELRGPAGVEAQARRMLADPRARALAENFAGQWLELRKLDKAEPSPDDFPLFHDHLRRAMKLEAEMFFERIVREDRSALEFLDANYTYLNNQLAALYGVEGVSGPEMRLVHWPKGAARGGVLGQAAVLTVSSYPTRTSPVLRGIWVLENLLGAPPPPAPAGVPPLDEAKIGPEMPLRKQYELHRSNPACAVCHVRMDAIGFGLENFDAIGRWRSEEYGNPIDSRGDLPDGRSFDGPAELRRILLEDRDEFARTLAEKMFVFALGRGTTPADRPAISAIARALAANEYRFSELIVGVVRGPQFRLRSGEGDGS